MTPETKVVAPVKQKLKVGVVSTLEHVVTLTRELKKFGHTVMPLPELGDRYGIPPSCQVVVCRVEGTSHRAVSICLKEARKGNRPVIFRTGTTRIMEKINEVANGQWTQDTILPYGKSTTPTVDIEDLTPQELGVLQVEAEREKECQEVNEAVCTMIDKGNVFTMPLMSLTETDAKDVICSVKYPTRDRVKRTALLDTLTTLQGMRSKVIEDQVVQLAEEFDAVDLWYQLPVGGKGVEKLIHVGWSEEQLNTFVTSLNAKSKNVQYMLSEPPDVIAEPQAEVSESEPEPRVLVPEPEPVRAVEIKTEEVVAEAIQVPVVSISLDVEKEISDVLSMLTEYMDGYGLESLPEGILERIGLSGSIKLNLVHMAGSSGTCCTKKGTRVTYVPTGVTCKMCQSTAEYTYALKLYSAWSAK